MFESPWARVLVELVKPGASTFVSGMLLAVDNGDGALVEKDRDEPEEEDALASFCFLGVGWSPALGEFEGAGSRFVRAKINREIWRLLNDPVLLEETACLVEMPTSFATESQSGLSRTVWLKTSMRN